MFPRGEFHKWDDTAEEAFSLITRAHREGPLQLDVEADSPLGTWIPSRLRILRVNSSALK